MRLLVVTNGYPPRGRFGTEFYARELVRGLRGRGHEVEVLHPVRDGKAARYSLETVEEGGVPVHLLTNAGDPSRRFQASYRDPEVERVFTELVRARGIELVHCVYLLWGLSVGLPRAAQESGVPCLVTATDHGLVCHRGQMFDHALKACGGPHDAKTCAHCIRTPAPYDLPPLSRLVKRVAAEALAMIGGAGRVVTARDVEAREVAVRAAFEAATRVIAPTPPIGAALLARGLDPDKLVELVYAFDEAPYAAVRSQTSPPKPRIGFLGQLAPHKGLGTLLDAAKGLARERGAESFELVLHGAPSAGRHRLYADEVLRDVAPANVVRGAAFEPDEAPGILAGFTALAVPSEWDENAPLAVLQARAAGVPVIGSDVGGIRCVIDEPQHGRLVPPGNVGAWTEALAAAVDGELPRASAPGLPLSLPAHLDRIDALYAEAISRGQEVGR